MEAIGVIIMDWKRPQNMEQVISAVKKQSIPSDIYVVHQGNDRKYDVVENINLDTNHGPELRFQILPVIPNRYVVNLDDDIEIVDRELFEKMQKLVKKHECFVSAIGLNINFNNPDEPYTSGKKIENPLKPTPCDIALPGLSMCNRLQAIRYYPYKVSNQRKSEEGIIMSWGFLQYVEHNYVVQSSQTRQALDMSFGLAQQSIHPILRNNMVKRLWEL